MRPGKCYRLYTEADYRALAPGTIPEMQRSNLAGVLLQMKALGITNVVRFPFLSPPPAAAMARGLELLLALGAIGEDGSLVEPLGARMAELPLEPQQAKMLLESGPMGCSQEIAAIVAMLQVQHVFVEPRNRRRASQRARLHFSVHEGDLLTMLNVFLAFLRHRQSPQWCSQNFVNYKSLARAVEVRAQLLGFLRRFGLPTVSADGDDAAILRCIAKGYFANAARLGMDGKYKTIRDGQVLEVHPSSCFYVEDKPKYVVYGEVGPTAAARAPRRSV